jgi:DNA-binding NtrC family response regulator
MARALAPADSLAKLLDESSRPIYVVDAQRRIVYCNAALAEWMDLPPKRIVERRVEYHSEEQKSDDKARDDTAPLTDLCPSPRALAGEAGAGTISCQARDGRVLHRAAEFVPLDGWAGQKRKKPRDGNDAELYAVLVVLARDELSPQQIATGIAGQSSADELHRSIRRFRRGQSKYYSIQSLLGSSSAMKKVRSQVDAAAASGANVLIYGNPGTGRGHIARAIHYKNATDDVRLVPVDCRLTTDDLMARTLDRLQSSRSESGSRPTLLLENLECMPSAHQSQLLAAIKENRIAARILATICTRVPVVEAEEAASDDVVFDTEDPVEEAQPATIGVLPTLVDAISTIAIRVPRLADRAEDLPVLAQFFLEACNRNNSKQVGSIRADSLDALALYSWPGELEQLRETIEAAHEACVSHELVPSELPPVIHRAFHAAAHARKQPERIILDELLASIEKEAIVRALAQAGGNKSEAASLLGMTRPRFYRRLVQLGLAGESSENGEAPETPEFIEHDATE